MSSIETAHGRRGAAQMPASAAGLHEQRPEDGRETPSILADLGWPITGLPDALEALTRRTLPPISRTELNPPPAWLAHAGDESLSRWIEAAAASLGAEAEPLEVHHADVERLLRVGAPALLQLPADEEPRFLAIAGGGAGRPKILAPDLGVRRIERVALGAAIRSPIERPVSNEVDRLLAEAGVEGHRRHTARAAFLADRLAIERIGRAWLLRLPPGASLWRRMLEVGTHRHLLAIVGAHLVQYLLWIASWWMVGRAALEGHLDLGWLAAWGLLLLTLVPFRLLLDWSQGLFAVGAGGLIKQRLLYGALRLEAEEIRHQGAGQLLGRVIESEAVESLALSGGVLGLMAIFELLVSGFVLAAGAGGAFHGLMLIAWLGVALALGWAYVRQRRRWAESRLSLTNDLVERMAGHRTRLAQELPERWHEHEDQSIERYLRLSQAMDRAAALLLALVPRGWLVLGILGLAPAFVTGQVSPAALAIGLGGVLLAYQAFEKLTFGLGYVAGAAIAWNQVAPLYRAAARPEQRGSPAYAAVRGRDDAPASDGHALVDASELSFRHGSRAEPVFRGLSLKIGRGDRTLLEGPSGGGKSTLASLIAGLRVPDSGLVLLRGLDRQTLGAEGWRRHVATAPQFHENHVLSETFAFNLLMGRRWPPTLADFAEAERVCRELGLGELLDRMPAGLLQVVGDTGWQLSHGERSRLYIARAILQDAELVVLDESFAALDPETLERSLSCVLRRAPTLLVIAHP